MFEFEMLIQYDLAVLLNINKIQYLSLKYERILT